MFSEAIKNMIHQYEGKMLVINRLSPSCICAKVGTNQPEPGCRFCLGTGKKIRITEIKGVAQESNGASTMRKNADYTITKEIFIDAKYTVKADDLIVFEDQVFKIYQIKMHRLSNNEPVYAIVYATPLKYDSSLVLKNLRALGVMT